MKIIQTFATDWIEDRFDYNFLTQTLLYHLLSALTIRDVYGPDQEFILITDTKGKELLSAYNFPYTTITTDLDNYPYTRPVHLVGYKPYSFKLYPNDKVIHIDNDVFLKKKLPEFTEVIVQSNEGNYITYNEAMRDAEYYSNFILPAGTTISDYTHCYNPGVIGFSSDCSIKTEYVNTYHTVLEQNTDKLISLATSNPELRSKIYGQSICTLLEESLLYNLCRDNSINVVEVIDPSIAGTVTNYIPAEDNHAEYHYSTYDRLHDYCLELGYFHIFQKKRHQKSWVIEQLGNMDSNATNTFIPNYKEEIKSFLAKRDGLSISPTNNEIALSLKYIIRA